MPDSQTASTYNEPTVMWRMQRGQGAVMHIMIAPTARGANVTWFVSTHMLGSREFTDWTDAIAWSDRIRDQNWAIGWRLTPDTDV